LPNQIDLQPTPARGEEVAELMDDDEQVEKQDDLQKRNRAEECRADAAKDDQRDDDYERQENQPETGPGPSHLIG